ncbi:MAG: polysaccharide biosynthesis protein [Betaproteobacteria bacterium]|nr:polysaccharide biosynthesis protein [Betaproteobacteria bacterium]
MPNHFRDKTILITGGTGSFGHALLAHLLKVSFKEVRIFSRDELKQEMMRLELDNSRVKFHIGDVRDRDSVDEVMTDVDYVFHAAALKQVPSCDFFPMEAVSTNVIGSHNVIESAIANKVRRVICLSTDKAVHPINAMGMTKALMEKVAQAASRRRTGFGTIVAAVRYGNVMYSRGSVIPLFVKQLLDQSPLTVTEPGMTRFMLPLSDAIKLVMIAFALARPGDIFIKKAPACTIDDLGSALKRLFSSNVKTRVIGMRHGEKLFETLATREELRRAEDLGGYFRVRMDDRDLDYKKYFTEGDRKEAETQDYTSHNTQRLNLRQVERLLLTLPEIRAEIKRGKAGNATNRRHRR